MIDAKDRELATGNLKELGRRAILAGFCAFEQVARSHSDLTYRTDARDCLQWVSQAGARALGHADPSALVGRPAAEALYRGPQQRAPLLESLAASQGPVCQEEVLRRADGTPLAVRTRAENRADGSGGMEAHVLILSGEIEARVTLAKALREMEIIFDNALIGMALVRNRRIEKVNARGAELFGCATEELLGRESLFLFPTPEEKALFIKRAYGDLHDTGVHVAEYALSRRDGSSLVLRTAARQVSPCDESEGVIWAFDDVTDQKRLEKELVASKQAAEAANRAKSQFLANISHELRSPLNGILGMAQLLLDKAGDGESREYLEIIQESAATLMHIVGDLLDLSNVEAGRMLITDREFDPRAELTPLLRNYAAQSQLRSFDFSYAFDPSLPARLVGDPNRIKQILINLIGNAFKYTKKGQVSVQIGRVGPDAAQPPAGDGQNGPGDRARLRLLVADTGVGIAPERQSTIFEPFGLDEDALTKGAGGAGLGLSIARKLANLMGGDIALASEPGTGSTFAAIISCGLPASGARVRSKPASGPKAESSAVQPDGGLRILLAEDEPVNRIFTVRALQKLGHTVDTADDGREALVLLGRGAYDLVLMDIQMPRLNGLEATRLIRSGQVEGTAPTIPVVALTAYAMDSDRQKGLEAGMDEYVTKPFEPAELVAAMERALAK